MTALRIAIATFFATVLGVSVAQSPGGAETRPQSAPPAPQGERAPRPDSASNARVGGWCDALTGEKKEQCLREERQRQDQTARGPGLRGTCDALIGPEKERCLVEGGSIEVDAKTGAGGTAGSAARDQ
jgi:hypothetical protein